MPRFNPPPGWPAPPAGWTPTDGWQPDPTWPPAPAGWSFWVDDAPHPAPTATRRGGGRRLGIVAAASAGAVALVVMAALQAAHGEPTAPTSATSAGRTAASTPKASEPTASDPTTAATTATTAAETPEPTTPSSTPSEPPSTTTTTTTTPTPGTALAALASLRVAGRAPQTGYDRARFGQAWADVDRNGCDTRNDVLRRDLTRYTLKAGTHGCLVLKGTLHDPYTARTIAFVRGQTTSIDVQIDHVVALSDAWQKGAQGWSAAKRTAFANDSLNLLAVDGPTNASKGDGDAATWLPPSKSYRCAYVARQVAVKRSYGLWVTRAEKDAIARVLARCPDQRLPAATPFRLGGGTVAAAPAPSTTTKAPAPAKTSSSAGTDPRFGTCKEAKSAGFGPYQRGVDPEYDWYRDNDHDGWVCE
ncbi:MAG: GmrSD restriction endonuclease domain-containing protein [Angustibacter sp.]